MVRRAPIAACALIGLVLLVSSAAAHQVKTVQDVTIRVTSSDPEEVLRFEAAILWDHERPELVFLKGKTPYTYETKACLLNAVFKRRSGKAELVVEVETRSEGWSRGTSSARAEAIIVGQNVGNREGSFIMGM